jgi:cbb3-type cytochrome oxidase subunit 1
MERIHGRRDVLLDGAAPLRHEALLDKRADFHFYLGTFGILLYVVSMWTSGITQGLMWRATDAQGALVYPNFVETLNAIRPMYWMRLIGGTAYLVGMIMMAWNLAKTALAGKRRGWHHRRSRRDQEETGLTPGETSSSAHRSSSRR